MASTTSSHFLFTVCQVGAEPALKSEIARNHPDLKFAFSRPGFVTFKRQDRAGNAASIDPDFELDSVFARAYGLSVGKCSADSAGEIVALATELAKTSKSKRGIVIHVWERDQYAPDEEPKGYTPGEWTVRAERAIGAAAQGAQGKAEFEFEKSPIAQPDDIVIDVVAVEEPSKPGSLWYGWHLQTAAHSPWPGADPVLEIPNDAPSRAYVKLEHALLWSGAPVQKGDTAVEIGSAPGGATYALLRRGLRVVGIDPGEMDPVVFKKGFEFKQIQRPVATVLREELPESVEWLLVDMNVSPNVSLFAVDRLGTRMKDTLLGVLLTVKLNQWKMADEIPAFLDHVKAMGMAKVRATQLTSNRQEIFIFGLTRKGRARLAGQR